MKKTALLPCLFALVLTFCSCKPVSSVTGSQISAHYPITLIDQAGREVTLTTAPTRIVSSYYITSSALIALDLVDEFAGIESEPEKRPIYALSAPSLLDLPTVGSPKDFSLESCLAVNPDLVILPMKLKDAGETLSDMGIPVLMVNPESYDQLMEMLDLIAAACDRTERLANLKAFLVKQQEVLAALEDDAPTVYMAGNSSFLSTSGRDMFQADMIRRAGGINAADEIEDSYWAQISYEQLLTWNPDVILCASNAAYTPEELMNDPVLQGINAVINERIYTIPSKAEAWDSPVPGSILGSLWVAAYLHPDKINTSYVNSVIDDYYETFYGFKYSEK